MLKIVFQIDISEVWVFCLIIRDGLKESNVVTKTFTVDDSGLPSDDDNGLSSDFEDRVRSENDYTPSRCKSRPQSAIESGRAKVV